LAELAELWDKFDKFCARYTVFPLTAVMRELFADKRAGRALLEKVTKASAGRFWHGAQGL